MVGISNFQHLNKSSMLKKGSLMNLDVALSAVQLKKHKPETNGGGGGYARQQREMFPAVCATCGKETTVPFQPSGDKPVYCRECYQPRTRSNW